MWEAGFNRSADLPCLRVSDRTKAGANSDHPARRRPTARDPNSSAGGDSSFLVGILLAPLLLLADHSAFYRLLSPGFDGATGLSTAGHGGAGHLLQVLPGDRKSTRLN